MAKAQPVTTIKASPLAVFYARALAEGNISRVETQKDGSIIVWNSREHRNTMRMKNGL